MTSRMSARVQVTTSAPGAVSAAGIITSTDLPAPVGAMTTAWSSRLSTTGSPVVEVPSGSPTCSIGIRLRSAAVRPGRVCAALARTRATPRPSRIWLLSAKPLPRRRRARHAPKVNAQAMKPANSTTSSTPHTASVRVALAGCAPARPASGRPCSNARAVVLRSVRPTPSAVRNTAACQASRALPASRPMVMLARTRQDTSGAPWSCRPSVCPVRLTGPCPGRCPVRRRPSPRRCRSAPVRGGTGRARRGSPAGCRS